MTRLEFMASGESQRQGGGIRIADIGAGGQSRRQPGDLHRVVRQQRCNEVGGGFAGHIGPVTP